MKAAISVAARHCACFLYNHVCVNIFCIHHNKPATSRITTERKCLDLSLCVHRDFIKTVFHVSVWWSEGTSCTRLWLPFSADRSAPTVCIVHISFCPRGPKNPSDSKTFPPHISFSIHCMPYIFAYASHRWLAGLRSWFYSCLACILQVDFVRYRRQDTWNKYGAIWDFKENNARAWRVCPHLSPLPISIDTHSPTVPCVATDCADLWDNDMAVQSGDPR